MNPFYELNQRMAKLAEKQDQQDAKQVAESTAPKGTLATALFEDGEKWIQKAVNPKTKGNLHKALHVPQGETIPKAKIAKATHSKNPKLRHMAQFAKNVAKEDMTDEGILDPVKQAWYNNRAKAADSAYYSTEFPQTNLKQKANAAKAKADAFRAQRAPQGAPATKDIEQEGNEFTGNLAKAKAQHKDEFEVDGKKYKVVEADPTGLGEEEMAMDEGFKEMDAWLASREKDKGTGKFDKKKTSTGTVYTRKPETFDDPETDPEATGGAPKRVGRPKSAKPKDTERVTKGSHKYKMHAGKRVKKDKEAHGKMHEDGIPITDRGEYDDEAGMAKDQLHTIVRHARELEHAIGSHDNLPEWVQEKMGQIKGMMTAVTDYMLSQKERGIEVATGEEGITLEKAPPGAKAERMVKGIKKSLSKDGHLSGKDKAIAYATTWKAHNQGKVEEEGAKPDFLDVDKDGNKKETFKKAVADKKDKKVDETTTSGSVATAPAAAKSTKGMQFGKGVYESINTRVEGMITESMNITVNMSTDEHGEPHKSVTVTADGNDADKLAELLKMAGLGGQSHAATCDACGQTPCGCAEVVDENKPDWPTEEETLAAQPELRTYSGGLNGPKSTGQTTVPVVASQLRRTSTMEENVELERSLFKTWKNYKG